ncbi:MAG: hypothetical protein K2R93_12480 [Gemmatimonadaceae bacterium]|nr:hypothetical protein [Gemmatimonadaceae bacterium]
MPCLVPALPDPTPLLVQGDEMRDGILSVLSIQAPMFATPLATPLTPDALAVVVPALLSDNLYAPMHEDMAYTPADVLYDPLANPALLHFNIVCPDGTSLNVLDGDMPLVGQVPQSSSRWLLNLQTSDTNAVAVASVRCLALDVGQLAVGRPAVVAEGISNGAGVLALEVPQNSDYLVVAYRSGVSDLAGVSAQTLSPDPA